MASFNSPPGWPAPPTPEWQPPPGWKPDPSWPAAPAGWAFWLNARGARARGPYGRYGADWPAKLIAGWGATAAAFVVVLAALGGNNATGASEPGTTVTAPAPTVTAPAPTVTVPGPTSTMTVEQTVPGPTATVTQAPLPARTVTVPAPRTSTTRTTAPVPLVQNTQTIAPRTTTTTSAGATYYANCAAVRAAGKAPLYRGQPGYSAHLDRDGDGVACE